VVPLLEVLRHPMDHEVTTLTPQRHETRSGLPALRRAVATLASVAPIRRRGAAGPVQSMPYAHAQLGFVIAGSVLTVGLAANGLIGWRAWVLAPALVGLALARVPTGGWWTGRRSSARRSALRPRVAHEHPRVIREPESGWWDAHPDPSPTAMTVAVVSESEARWGAEAVVSRLAELAVNDELLVVYGTEQRSRPGHHAVVAGLRRRLPRHHVVAVHVAQHGVAVHVAQPGTGLGREDAALLDQYLENGSLPVVVIPASAIHDVTAELSSCLRADRVLRVHRTSDGVGLHQVWRRHATASAG
jgi:hypothetical protein